MLYIGADHRGFKLKEELKKIFDEKGIVFEDLGNLNYEKKDDFPVFSQLVARKIVEDQKNKGILICGSGIGMSISANRFKGVRAGLCLSKKIVQSARAEDDINILVLAADFINLDESREIIEEFLNTDFQPEERYKRRIKMIDNYLQ